MTGLVALPGPGEVVGGKYVVESMLGATAAGAVFRTRHKSTGRRFAVRWISSPASAADPLSELAAGGSAQFVGCFNHQIFLSPLDVGRSHDALYVVMEWLEGETLATRLERLGSLPLSEAAAVLVPCMRAVHEAHLAQVVHGDLHPGNIFICHAAAGQPETMRVFDYGLGGSRRDPERLAREGRFSKDAAYLAPEQIKGAGVDSACDIYAFGVLLYSTLTGRLPFSPERSDEFARFIYAQDPPAPPGAPGITPTLYKLLERALARDVSARLQNCEELANALESLVRDGEQHGVSVLPTRFIGSAAQNKTASVQPSTPALRPSARAALPPSAAGVVSVLPAQAVMGVPQSSTSARAAEAASGPHRSEPIPPPRSTASARPGAPRATEPLPTPSLHAPAQASRRAVTHDLPHESFSPLAYRRPLDRRVMLAAACFAVVGLFPALAYYAPPVERRDAASDALPLRAPVLLPARQPSTTAMHAAYAPALERPAAPSIAPAPVAAAGAATSPAAKLVDDPSTPLDESDPLIAAALDAIHHAHAAGDVAMSAPSEVAAPKNEAKAAVVTPHRVHLSAPSSPRPAGPRLSSEPTYAPLPAASALPWEKPATRPGRARATESKTSRSAMDNMRPF